MRPFRELTRRGRLARMRKLGYTAVKAYGFEPARLSFIQYGENIIYRVDLPTPVTPIHDEDPYISNRYVLRIHAISDPDTIDSELTWLAALNQEAGLPVPTPVMTPDGKTVTHIVTPGVPNGRNISVMRWLDGRRLGNGLRPRHLTALGRVVAQMHTFSSGWLPPAGFDRPHWDWDSQLGGSMFRHPMEQIVASIPPRFKEQLQFIYQEAKLVMELFGKGPDVYGMIHADLYPENVLFKGGKAFPIDFEDCGYGYWMWDIAIALCTWAWGNAWELMQDAFKEGYTQIRVLPEHQWAKLDLFVAIQFATMVLWSSALLMNDPKRVAEYVPWREDNGTRLLGYFNR
jgi:Ser/Thr protein kinase RdoA (MazF antagonist)